MIPRIALLLVLSPACVLAGAAADLDRLAELALSGEEAEAADAAAALRRAGAEALPPLLARFDRAPGADPARLDRLCAQRDCTASRLFWYTDLESAVAAARAERKPILSLRLLGRLDEEMSCANSRFFRTVLYPDPRVSSYLREHFVLHWRSVRPVPVVRIDFGDGRTLERPLTGNSIHYVLGPSGRLVDALPGLYAPAIFLRELQAAAAEIAEVRHLPAPELARWARGRSARLVADLEAELQRDYLRLSRRAPVAAGPARVADRPVDIGTLAITKARAELPILRSLRRPSDEPGPWDGLAELYLEAARLDPASRSLVLAKQLPPTPGATERLVATLERDIARDTVLNQFRFRLEIHQRLAAREHPVDLEAFNAEVYAELFETPADDPWLGLAPSSLYAALPGGGRSTAAP